LTKVDALRRKKSLRHSVYKHLLICNLSILQIKSTVVE